MQDQPQAGTPRPIDAAPTPADDAFQQARSAVEAGDAASAQALYRRCLSLDPTHGAALHDLGVLAARQNDDAGALDWLRQAVALHPDLAEARDDLFAVLFRSGRYADAVEVGSTIAASSASSADVLFKLGVAHEALSRVEEAARWFRAAFEADPTSAAPPIKLANALRSLGRLDEALVWAERGVALEPAHFGGLIIRALVLDGMGDSRRADEDFAVAAAVCPDSVEALNALGVICIRQGRFGDAVEALTRAVRLGPGAAEPHGNLGLALQKLGRPREAFEAYVKTVSIEPRNVVAQCNLAGLLIDLGQWDAAIAACRIAAKVDPTNVEANVYLGIALRRRGSTREALGVYRHVLAHQPKAGEALIEATDLRLETCDWEGFAAEQAAALDRTYKRGLRVPPFQVLPLTDSAAEHLAAARVWAAGFGRPSAPLASSAPRTEEVRKAPLKIGYLSADFRTHATAMLVAELFELHDRRRFETFGYSCGDDDASPMRRRLVAGLDHFVDIRSLSHGDAAQKIHADGIDILIDLKGYTRDGRPQILVHRPAAIQVNFLGYPGTMGAAFVDYIIADDFLVPPGHDGFFDEKIVRLPHSYQPNDSRRAMASEQPTRASCGLPEQGFVFCCFNQPYKITPDMFGLWMRLLRRVPESVLWLFDGEGLAGQNLRSSAAAAGIDPARVITAPRVAPEAHLSRLPLADLFLDTLPVNAHTTASEALWAGVPLVTLPGEAFASRVAGSLLHAVGLPELVAATPADYEALAVTLAEDPPRLERLRLHLAAARTTAPLFDTPRYARNFEAALARMAMLRDEGRPPASFTIREAEDDPDGREPIPTG